MPATREKNRTHGPQPASAATTHVSAIMSRDVITVRSGTSVDVVAEVMLSRGLSRVPGVQSTSTHIAFRSYYAGDTDAAFAVGLD